MEKNNPFYGKKHSEETKRKIGDKSKGRQANLGNKMSKESKKMISIANKGRLRGIPKSTEHRKKIGEANFKGGNRYYWMKQSKIRDDYTCQICGLREPEIVETDHIVPKSTNKSLEKDINNMITLCPNCHRRKTNRDIKQRFNIN